MAVVGTLREFLCQQGLFQGSQFARQGLAQQGPSGGKFFAGPGFFCATSMSNSGVRSSANQKRICAGLGCARFSKKLASMSRRIIGQSLSRWVFLARTKSGSESKSHFSPPGIWRVVRRRHNLANASSQRILDITRIRRA